MSVKQLSENWNNAVLQELFDFVIGGDWGLDPEKEADENYVQVICIRGSEIKNWKRDKGSSAAVRMIKSSSLDKRKLQEGDILLEISGGGPDQPVGRTLFIDKDALSINPDLPKVCSNFLRLVRLSRFIDKKYINHYLQYFYYTGEIVNYQAGSNNLRNLKFKEYSSIIIPIAPAAEQKRIVAKLDAAIKHVDVIKEKLRRIPELLKNFRQKVLTQAVAGKLTEKWRKENKFSDWQSKPLKEIIDKGSKISYGVLKPGNHEENGVPMVMSQHIKNNLVNEKIQSKISKSLDDQFKKTKLKGGEILLTLVGASIGRLAIVPPSLKGANVSRAVAVIRIDDEYCTKWILYYLISLMTDKYIQEVSTGTAQPVLNVSVIREIAISIPHIEEQKDIVRKVEALFSKANTVETQYISIIEHIDRLPKALLAKAFRGELVEQEKNDEPASVLLKKIKELKISKK